MLSRAAVVEKIKLIRQKVTASIPPFSSDPGGLQKQKRLRAMRDNEFARSMGFDSSFDFYCKIYKPNYFDRPTAQFQKDIDAEMMKNSGEMLLCILGRDMGKTTRWGSAFSEYSIISKTRHYIIAAGETEDDGADIVLETFINLMENPRIIHDYGNLADLGSWDKPKLFKKSRKVEFITTNNVKMEAIGVAFGQSPRGKIYGNKRPDLIVIHDPTKNYKKARRPDQEKEKMLALIAYLGALGSTQKDGKRQHVGTIAIFGNFLSKYSAANQLKKEVEKRKMDVFVFDSPVCDLDTGWVLVPEWNGIEYYQEEFRKMGYIVFGREYLNIDTAGGNYYSEEKFNPFTTANALDYWAACDKKIIYVDPSFGHKTKSQKYAGSDLKVALVMGHGKDGFFLFDAYAGQVALHTFGDALCELQKKWNVPTIWYEANFAQAVIMSEQFDMASQRTGVPLPYKGYYTQAAKDDRIQKGGIYCEQAKLWYCTDLEECQKVIDDLVLYPEIEKLDRADAFGTAIEVLEKAQSRMRISVHRR